MAVVDKKIHPYAAFVRQPIQFPVASVGINQAAVLFGAVLPYQGLAAISAQSSTYVAEPAYAAYGWQVEAVVASCSAIVATAQIDVLIGAVSVLTGLVTPNSVAGQTVPAQGTLVAPASRRGKFGDQLNMRVTTNGSGTLTNLLVTVTIRPFPADNEAA